MVRLESEKLNGNYFNRFKKARETKWHLMSRTGQLTLRIFGKMVFSLHFNIKEVWFLRKRRYEISSANSKQACLLSL